MLLNLLTDIVLPIFEAAVQIIGIRRATTLRLVCCNRRLLALSQLILMSTATFDCYIQDVLFNLPTFENVTGVQPPHLTRDPRMCKAMVTRLVSKKLESQRADYRIPTQAINGTLEFVESQPGSVRSAPRAADTLSLHEIVHFLSLQPLPCQMPLAISRKSLCAAIYLGDDSAKACPSETTTRAFVHTPRLFSDPLLIAARLGRENFLSQLILMEARSLPGCLMSLRVLNALEQAAAAGQLKTTWRILQSYGALPQFSLLYDCAIESALRASQVEAVMLLLLRRTKVDSQRTTSFQSMEEDDFWRELLQTASSTNCEPVATYILDMSSITTSISSLNLTLEDACYAGHTNMVRLLLSRCNSRNLTSYSGAVFWAARSENRDILCLLFDSVAYGDFVAFMDALCGAALSSGSAVSLVFELGAVPCVATERWPASLNAETFPEMVDTFLDVDAPSRFAYARVSNYCTPQACQQ